MLWPYSEVFERVVLPKVTELKNALVRDDYLSELRSEIDGFQRRRFRRLSLPALMYYGLLLCCYYCSAKWRVRDGMMTRKKLVLVRKAMEVIIAVYDHDKFADDLLWIV
jgi:hypothetical protein